jgi:hypothetical protein
VRTEERIVGYNTGTLRTVACLGIVIVMRLGWMRDDVDVMRGVAQQTPCEAGVSIW